ncbi:MAG: c-type cytochrome [Campylobacterota bacterium]
MNKLILGLSITTTLFLTSAAAENTTGKSIFEAKGCVMCHKPDVDTIGPSLKTIGKSYMGKISGLITYLQGQGTPIVDPARAPVMNPQLVKIRTLSEEDMRALAEHLLSLSERPL